MIPSGSPLGISTFCVDEHSVAVARDGRGRHFGLEVHVLNPARHGRVRLEDRANDSKRRGGEVVRSDGGASCTKIAPSGERDSDQLPGRGDVSLALSSVPVCVPEYAPSAAAVSPDSTHAWNSNRASGNAVMKAPANVGVHGDLSEDALVQKQFAT